MKKLWLGLLFLSLVPACGTGQGATIATTSPSSMPSASPSRVVDYGPPPEGLPLIYVQDPNHAGWLIGFDWTATPRATLKPWTSPGFMHAAPDGSAFLQADGSYLDRVGMPVVGPPAPAFKAKPGGLWADDSTRLCFVEIDMRSFVWTLYTQVPGEALHQVAVIAQDHGIGQSGIRALACSFKNNRAVLVRDSIAWESEVWVVSLSDGGAVSYHSYPYDPNALVMSNMVATPDGAYVAENRESSTLIRRVADWAVVQQVETPYEVLAFSGDGSLVLTVKRPYTAASGQFAVIDWRTGRLAWTLDDGAVSLYRWTTGADNAEFALVLTSQTGPGELLVVQGDGITHSVPGRFAPLF